jgi:hypothetical protein
MSFASLRLARGIVAAGVTLFTLAPPCVFPVAAQTPPVEAAQAPQPAQPVVAPVPVAPIPWFVVDVRGGFPALGQDQITADSLGVALADLPGRAKTAVLGAHVYPLRRSRIKLGLGAELIRGSASSQRKDAKGVAAGPVVHRRLNAVSTQASLNFGRGAGWSYLTVGMGPFKFESSLDEAVTDSEGTSTLNFGGGARWFNWEHLAFTVDLRFYRTKAAPATLATAARGPARIVIFSAGISIK